jgi:hypothetical protein
MIHRHVAGPKLRKWYGETDKMLLPQDGGDEQGEEENDDDEDTERSEIVVTDADTPLGQLVVLQLVLARCAFQKRISNGDATR